MFFVNLLEANLKTRLIGTNITYYTITKSTNDDIWEIWRNGGANGEVVVADNQTHGRGQRSNKWISNPGQDILCSFLLFENLKKKSIGIYSILIAIGITKGIQQLLSLDIQLKWPNDLYIENKKIGGILIESKFKKNNLILNIGFGINVNESLDEFPEDIIEYTTSLKAIYGYPIQRELLLANILNAIDQLLQNIDPLQLAEEWNKRCFNIDQQISFNYKNQIRTGIFKKINSRGQSIIEYNKEQIIFDGAIIQS